MKPSDLQQKKIGAGVAGAGSGTVLGLLIESVPDSHWCKRFLVLALPTVSVAITVGSYHLAKWTALTYHQWRLTRERTSFQISAKKVLSDDNISDEHKTKVKNHLEEISNMELDARIGVVRILNKTVFDLQADVSLFPANANIKKDAEN